MVPALPLQQERAMSIRPIAVHRLRPTHRARGAVLAVAATFAGLAWAQTVPASNVLSGTALTEDRLLEALTPSGDVTKRSLRVKATGAALPMPPAQRPSASLLVTFHTASSELTDQARQQLDIVGAALKNDRLASYRFTVEGHADPRGDPQSNLVLSQHRAGSVRSYLVDAHGIDPQRLVAEGKGDRELMNRTQPTSPENRRVTIVTQLQ
jgi:outer membrane protein OmpA-like peptidoglycan-associated protein